MNDLIEIRNDQCYITLSPDEIILVCCELNKLYREHITRSHSNLDNFGLHGKMSLMQQKFHQWYYVDLLISEYLSYSE